MKKRIGELWYHSACKSYYCKIDGKQKRLLKGDENPANEQLAQMERAKRMVALGSEQVSETEVKPAKVYYGAYLDEVKDKVAPNSLRNTEWLVGDFMANFGERPLYEIKDDDVDLWLGQKEYWGETTKTKALRQLSAFFNSKFVKRAKPDNPCKTAKKHQEEVRGEDVAISEVNYLKLREHASDLERDILDCLWFTGARPTEILDLRWTEVHGDQNCIIKEKHKTAKKGKIRQIMFPAPVRAILSRRTISQNSEFLFPARDGQPIKAGNFLARMKRMARDAKIIEPIIAYGLRHGFAVHALKKGISVELVSAWLGHASIQVTQKHYAKLCTLLGGSVARLDMIFGQ